MTNIYIMLKLTKAMNQEVVLILTFRKVLGRIFCLRLSSREVEESIRSLIKLLYFPSVQGGPDQTRFSRQFVLNFVKFPAISLCTCRFSRHYLKIWGFSRYWICELCDNSLFLKIKKMRYIRSNSQLVRYFNQVRTLKRDCLFISGRRSEP